MIEGVAAVIIGKFVINIKKTLEVSVGEEAPLEGAPAAVPGAEPQLTPQRLDEADDSINVLAVVFKVIWTGIVNFFKRLFGKGK